MVKKIETMTTAAQATQNPCISCGGRGWKFVILRRSGAQIANAGEAKPGSRKRIDCLHCQTTPATAGDQNEGGRAAGK